MRSWRNETESEAQGSDPITKHLSPSMKKIITFNNLLDSYLHFVGQFADDSFPTVEMRGRSSSWLRVPLRWLSVVHVVQTFDFVSLSNEIFQMLSNETW
jgi:hypothetical protein